MLKLETLTCKPFAKLLFFKRELAEDCQPAVVATHGASHCVLHDGVLESERFVLLLEQRILMALDLGLLLINFSNKN